MLPGRLFVMRTSIIVSLVSCPSLGHLAEASLFAVRISLRVAHSCFAFIYLLLAVEHPAAKASRSLGLLGTGCGPGADGYPPRHHLLPPSFAVLCGCASPNHFLHSINSAFPLHDPSCPLSTSFPAPSHLALLLLTLPRLSAPHRGPLVVLFIHFFVLYLLSCTRYHFLLVSSPSSRAPVVSGFPFPQFLTLRGSPTRLSVSTVVPRPPPSPTCNPPPHRRLTGHCRRVDAGASSRTLAHPTPPPTAAPPQRKHRPLVHPRRPQR